MPGFGVSELLIIFAIILVPFGAARLAAIGGAPEGAIREFPRALQAEAGDEDGPPAGSPDSV
jgi:Sec-independent protein translocase protein TatA